MAIYLQPLECQDFVEAEKKQMGHYQKRNEIILWFLDQNVLMDSTKIKFRGIITYDS